MVVQFDEDVALATNPALAQKNTELKGEKLELQSKYNALVTSSGQLATRVNELEQSVASGQSLSQAELAIANALKGVKDLPPADDLKKMLKEYPQLKAQVEEAQQAQHDAKIAGTMGWKPEAFKFLRTHPELGKDLAYSVETVMVEEKPVEKVYVTHKDASGVQVKSELQTYAATNWATFDNFLKAAPDAVNNPKPSWLPQVPAEGTSAPPTNFLDAHIAERNQAAAATGNALIPAPTPTPSVATA